MQHVLHGKKKVETSFSGQQKNKDDLQKILGKCFEGAQKNVDKNGITISYEHEGVK